MINPSQSDIGRRVIYFQTILNQKIQIDEGVITSFNDQYIFVLYRSDTTTKATKREDLEYWTDVTVDYTNKTAIM